MVNDVESKRLSIVPMMEQLIKLSDRYSRNTGQTSLPQIRAVVLDSPMLAVTWKSCGIEGGGSFITCK